MSAASSTRADGQLHPTAGSDDLTTSRKTLFTIAPLHYVYDERVLRSIDAASGIVRCVYGVDREYLRLTQARNPDILEEVRERTGASVDIVLLPPWKRIRFVTRFTRHAYALAVARQARSIRPDIVHIHESGSLGVLIAYWVSVLVPGCRVIFDYHDWIPSEIIQSVRNKPYLYRAVAPHVLRFYRRLARSIDTAVCISPSQAEWTRDVLGVRDTVVIQNVRPRLEVSSTLPAEWRPRFVWAGHVMRVRRLEFIIDAMVILRESGIKVDFTVFGDLTEPEYAEHLKRYAVEAGVGDALSFYGKYRDDRELVPALSEGAVAIALAVREPVDTGVNRIASANKLFTYMALGVPVLLEHDYESMARILESCGAGTTFSSPDELARRAQLLWTAPDEWRRMSAGGRRAAERMNSDTCRDALRALYTS